MALCYRVSALLHVKAIYATVRCMQQQQASLPSGLLSYTVKIEETDDFKA